MPAPCAGAPRHQAQQQLWALLSGLGSHCPASTEEDVHAQYSQLLNVAQQVASPLAQTPGWCCIALEVCVLFLSHLIVKCVQELQINLKITLKTL